MKFTSTLLRQAWTLAKQVAGEGSPRRFFGWALKEVRMEQTGETIEQKVAKLTPRQQKAVMFYVNNNLMTLEESYEDFMATLASVADTKPAPGYIGPTGSTGYYGPNGFD